MIKYNMTKIFICVILWLMFSGIVGHFTWPILGLGLFIAGIGYGVYRRDRFLKSY